MGKPTDLSIDPERFESALSHLVASAHQDGVDVEGAWVCRSDGDLPDWEIESVELVDGRDPVRSSES